MNQIIIAIVINIILVIIFTAYARYIFKLSGKNEKDEMFKYFKEKSFKKIGIILMILSGISLLLNTFILATYSGNLSDKELLLLITSDFKYFIIASMIYIVDVIKLKIDINKSDEYEK